jgi:hypothetical protein
LTDDVPTFIALKELYRRGFRVTDEPLPLKWKDGEPQRLGSRKTDFVNRRFFLICLVNWGSLRDKGLIALPTNQPHAYYKLVMKAQEPAGIPLALCNSEYIAICDGGPVPEPVLPVEDFGEPDAVEDDSAPLPIDDAVARPAKRRRVVVQVVEEPDQVPDASSSSSSSSSSSCDGVEAMFQPARQGHNQATGVFIGSKQVFIEQHLKRGERGAYCRLILPCHMHTGANAQGSRACKKHRNVHVSLGVQGVRESLAFLVAWARASNMERHVRFQPSKRMVTDVLDNSMYLISGDIEQLASKVSEF